MASDQPYNELGQILSEGGEIAVGLALLQDMTDAGFLLFFSRRFSPIREDDADALIALSNLMIDGGGTLQGLPAGADISIGDIPLNEFLFGGDLQGRRALVTGEVQLPGASSRVQLRLAFPDIPSIDELRQAFLDRSFEIASQYPEKFGLGGLPEPQLGDVFILLPERAF